MIWQTCSINIEGRVPWCSWVFRRIHKKASISESYLIRTGYWLIKKRLQPRAFFVNCAEFLRTHILKKFCKSLLTMIQNNTRIICFVKKNPPALTEIKNDNSLSICQLSFAVPANAQTNSLLKQIVCSHESDLPITLCFHVTCIDQSNFKFFVIEL